ncbi:LacI family transcriptional regulator [Sphaerisporangium sp. NBC_01403]|uniref:LacI family DNA-binding transcriptional regulator n=1 Tax=Sphaerisporangium sp. NBC_01403 TaxID=2903599 RepID=UPI00324481D2
MSEHLPGNPASGRRRRPPTQVDLARHAGVSQATVSQVINETPERPARLSPETRARVLDAVRELGYRVNAAARSLKGARNQLLGLFTFEAVFPTDQRDFYFPFLLGVEEEVADQGYDLVLFSSAGASGPRRIYVDGVNRLKLADGAVLLGRHVRRAELAELVREDYPFVFIGRRAVPGAQLSYVAADYASATRDLVCRLAELGHRRILFARERGGAEPTRDRERGYRQGLKASGLGADAAVVHRLPASGAVTEADLRAWADSGVTAIVAEPSEDDSVAAGIEAAAAAAGLSIPDDLSVALLGDPSLAGRAHDWTRFAIPRPEMGRQAVRLLIQLLDADDGEARQVLLDCVQIPGQTVAAPRRPGGRR